jgi:iron(III) transport system ATP-binding protein
MKAVGLQCRNLRLAYGHTPVLKDVSLDIAPGEFFALLGPSGSGKSTLLRVIAGFAQHQAGQLLVDGRDIGTQPPWQRQVGMVFQNYALWPHLSVWDNVAFGLVERKVAKAAQRDKVAAALELVGLAGYGERRPGQLSGGQQQRVALARTLVIEPQVLLLDEPLSNLDKTLRVQMRQELLALQMRLGLTTVFVTHDQEEAMTTADRMAVLDQGVVQQVGTPVQLYDTPVNAFVAGFVGTMNLLPAQVRECDAAICTVDVPGLGALRLPAPAGAAAGAALHLSFRPQALRLAGAGSDGHDPACAWFDAAVEGSEFLGASTRLRLRLGAHTLALELPHTPGSASLAAGAILRVGLVLVRARLLAGAAPA